MTVLENMRQLLNKFLQGLFSSHENNPAQVAKKMLAKQETSLKRLRHSLTELIFQRKKIESQLMKLEESRLALKKDLEAAAYQDRDQLALRLMEELDVINSELEQNSSHLELIVCEIEKAKSLETDLSHQIEKSKSQLVILQSRSQALSLRKDLQDQVSQIGQQIDAIKPGLGVVEESLLKLEAELENLQEPSEKWKLEVKKMRRERTDHIRQSRLQQLKIQLRSRQLPGQLWNKEVVRQGH